MNTLKDSCSSRYIKDTSVVWKTIKLLCFSVQPVKRYIGTMSHPLIAVCQMRAIADKVKNLEVVTELAAEAKRKSAMVRILGIRIPHAYHHMQLRIPHCTIAFLI